jgi:pyrroloquinoline quinone biosynthesis protein E
MHEDMAPPPAPIGLLAELTHRCPLQCPYCSNPLALERPRDELPTSVWLDVLTQAAGLGVLQLHLSGGEPTARRDLEEIIAHAAGLGLYTNLITSGVLLRQGRIDGLAAAGLDHVQISMQDVKAGNADRIARMRGAHTKKLEAARLVRAAGLPLTLNAPIHRQNIGSVEAFIRLAVGIGAQRLEIAHVQYYGWALANRAALMPTHAQVLESLRVVEASRNTLRGRLIIDFVVPDYYASAPKPCMGGWGRGIICVTPSGAALPCHAAQTIPGLRFDNVKEQKLQDIWLASEAFQAFRGTHWMREPCRTCERRTQDWGGCRCQAFTFAGNAAKADPACAKSLLHLAFTETAERESHTGPPPFRFRNPRCGNMAD